MYLVCCLRDVFLLLAMMEGRAHGVVPTLAPLAPFVSSSIDDEKTAKTTERLLRQNTNRNIHFFAHVTKIGPRVRIVIR